jgi:Copper transport outer membrane protein, MctB
VIDFRYHLVSIIAIFLALAVGLVVGATALPGPTESALSGAEHRLSQRNAALQTSNNALGQQVSADQAFAQASSARLLDGLLTGQKVVLVVPPNTASGLASSLTTALEQAGATVTGQVQLQQSFFDFSATAEANLTQTAQQLAPQAGVRLTPSSSPVSGQRAAADVLAAAILTRTPDIVGVPATSSHTILDQLGAPPGYLQVSPTTGSVLKMATLAVLLTPGGTPASSQQATDTNQALVAVAAALHSTSLGTVMAGSASAVSTGSAISLMGGSGPASTVDDADTASGQIMVVQALALLLAGKSPAAYGVGPGSAPSPAPTPSATPTVTPPPVTKGRRK